MATRKNIRPAYRKTVNNALCCTAVLPIRVGRLCRCQKPDHDYSAIPYVLFHYTERDAQKSCQKYFNWNHENLLLGKCFRKIVFHTCVCFFFHATIFLLSFERVLTCRHCVPNNFFAYSMMPSIFLFRRAVNRSSYNSVLFSILIIVFPAGPLALSRY